MAKFVYSDALRAYLAGHTTKRDTTDVSQLKTWLTANERDEAVVTPPPAEPPVEPLPPAEPALPMPLGIAGNWTPVMLEEFEGTTLNINRWNPNWLAPGAGITKPIEISEIAAYDPAQVKVANGMLHLTTAQRTVTALDGKTYNFISGMIEGNNRDGKGLWIEPGMVSEARIMFPDSGGAIPFNFGAFWQCNDPADPYNEIDTVENLGSGARPNYHSDTRNLSGPAGTISPLTGWHTYATHRLTDGTAKIYYDGKLIWTIDGVLPAKQYLICNHGMSDAHGGPRGVGVTMLCSHIRVWKPA